MIIICLVLCRTAERNYGKVSAGDDMFHREDVNINETVLAPLAKPLTKDRRSEKADLGTFIEIHLRRLIVYRVQVRYLSQR